MRKALIGWLAMLAVQTPLCGGENEQYELFAKVEAKFPFEVTIRSLHLVTRVGDIELVPADGPEMRVEAVVRVDRHRTDLTTVGKAFEQHVQIVQENGILTVADAHKDAADRKAWAVTMRVAVPRPLPITAQTGVGDVEVGAAAGAVSLVTGVGDVTLKAEHAATLSVKSGVGDVDLRVDNVEGQASVNTGTGDVTLTLEQLGGPLEAESGTGQVSLRIRERPSQKDVSLITGVGRLVLELPSDASGRFDLKTGAGSISIEPATALQVRRATVGSSASGQTGNGGPPYTLRTGVGAIAVKFRPIAGANSAPIRE